MRESWIARWLEFSRIDYSITWICFSFYDINQSSMVISSFWWSTPLSLIQEPSQLFSETVYWKAGPTFLRKAPSHMQVARYQLEAREVDANWSCKDFQYSRAELLVVKPKLPRPYLGTHLLGSWFRCNTAVGRPWLTMPRQNRRGSERARATIGGPVSVEAFGSNLKANTGPLQPYNQ